MKDIITLMYSTVLNTVTQKSEVPIDIIEVHRANLFLPMQRDCLIDFVLIKAVELDGEHMFNADHFMLSVHECSPYVLIKNGGHETFCEVYDFSVN